MQSTAANNRSQAATDPFVTTDWSAVLEATDATSPKSCAALGELYLAYHYPLYVFVRRRGYSAHDAQDVLHDFFATLIEKNYLKSVARERGRFRAFLLGMLKHFLTNDWHRSRREKRGGASTFVSLEDWMGDAERRFQMASSEIPPEVQFDREWARTLLNRVMSVLRNEFEIAGSGAQFEALKVFLSTPGSSAAYARAAADLGTTELAVKVAVHRLRQRYQAALRREIGQTVGPAGEIEAELRHLAAVLRWDL